MVDEQQQSKNLQLTFTNDMLNSKLPGTTGISYSVKVCTACVIIWLCLNFANTKFTKHRSTRMICFNPIRSRLFLLFKGPGGGL